MHSSMWACEAAQWHPVTWRPPAEKKKGMEEGPWDFMFKKEHPNAERLNELYSDKTQLEYLHMEVPTPTDTNLLH